MLERGRVVAIEEDALWVETIRQSTCGSCSARAGCGQGLLNRLGDGRRNHLRVLLGDCSPQDYRLDDPVEFSVSDNVLLKAAAVVYLMPLASMLVGMGLAHELSGSQGAAAIGALGGFALGFGLVRLHAWYTRNDPRLQPRLVSRMERLEAGAETIQPR